MTTTMPMIINSLFPFLPKSVQLEAKTSIEKGREKFAVAEQETQFGDIASTAGKANAQMAEIAVWHYERGIKTYLEALGEFEKASRFDLPTKYKNYVEKKMSDCMEKVNLVNLQKKMTRTAM
jgi:hypothetical protein